MKYQNHNRKHHLMPLMLSFTVLLSGCGSGNLNDIIEEARRSRTVPVNQPVSDETLWINSSIEGAVDETLQIRMQDDFFTAVNLEYDLQTTLADDENHVSALLDNSRLVKDRKLFLINENESAAYDSKKEGTAPVGLSEDQVSHNKELIDTYAKLASDWESRDALGVEPLRPYIELIENIDSLEAFTEYLTDRNNGKLENIGLVNFEVDAPLLSGNNHSAVILDHYFNFLMGDIYQYSELSGTQIVKNYAQRLGLDAILTDLGYSQEEAYNLWKLCMRFEIRVAEVLEHLPSYQSTLVGDEADQTIYTLEDIENMQGNYPMVDILRSYQLDQANDYRVYFPKEFEKVCALYRESNLDEIKAYFIIHTVLDAQPFLRRSDVENIRTMASDTNISSGIPGTILYSEDDEDLLLNFYFGIYFEEPLEEYYTYFYCTEEDKAELLNLTNQAIEAYSIIIENEDWLSDQTKQICIEKIQSMDKNILYPDVYVDYLDLDLSDCENLLQAISKIDAHEYSLKAIKLTQPFSRSAWRLNGVLATTNVNATYIPTNNSMNVYAGIIANEEVFNINDSIEENMAKIGTIIGHEISHSLDPTGREYDKNGDYVKDTLDSTTGWTHEDQEEYDKRVNYLTKYFSVLPAYPEGGQAQPGIVIKGEAIADVTGVKTMLGLAKTIDSFDYEEFFIKYAELWREQMTVWMADSYTNNDVHPLNYKRVNVSVQQFDEFYETFDVKEGDGMYLPEDKRLLVW